MPPAIDTLVPGFAVPSIPGSWLQLKKQTRKRKKQLVVYLATPSHKWSPVWLSLDVPSARLGQVRAALPEIGGAHELTADFKAKLLTGARVLPLAHCNTYCAHCHGLVSQ